VNRREQVTEILKTLLKTKQTSYTQIDIGKAIMECRGLDPRTIRNWFNYLWKLEYFVQPDKDLYQLNYEKVAELELDAVILNPEQRRLFNG
jgi:hypothetical protein